MQPKLLGSFVLATLLAVSAAAQPKPDPGSNPESALQVVGNAEIAAQLVSGTARERITGRVTYSQELLKEHGCITEARRRGVDSRGSGYSQI